jgi:hypothetical protein
MLLAIKFHLFVKITKNAQDITAQLLDVKRMNNVFMIGKIVLQANA